LHHIDFGGGPGSANLMIGEVVMFHVKESVYEGNYPNIDRIDLVARMGGPYYCRASGPAVFTLPKPSHVGIGFDALPRHVLDSPVLTGNDLGKLAGAAAIPSPETTGAFVREKVMGLKEYEPDDLSIELRVGDPDRALAALLAHILKGAEAAEMRAEFHRVAQCYLRRDKVTEAWHCVMAAEEFQIEDRDDAP